jgi:uncharacterized protein YcsI (UPF0317 family)
MADGLTIRHIEQGCNVPMYRTNVPCAPAGRFAADAIRAIQITTPFPELHGAPVYLAIPLRSASATSRSRTTATR